MRGPKATLTAAVWLGDVSYSVYLLHFPVMCLLAKIAAMLWVDPAAKSGPITASLLLFLATVAVTLPLAALSYGCIERPGIALGRAILNRVTSKGERSRALARPV